MNLEERMILWLEIHQEQCEERDLINDAMEELTRLRQCERLQQDMNTIYSVATLTQQLAEARALVTEAKERDKDVYWLSREWHARAEQLATSGACDDFSYRLKTLTILTKIASEAGRLDNPVRRLTRILEIIGTFEG
jgi:hypothetical protein